MSQSIMQQKQMIAKTYYDNKDLKQLKIDEVVFDLRSYKIVINQLDINKQTLLKDFYHDAFQNQASTTSKHLFYVFVSSLNFVIDQMFTEEKKFYLIDLEQIFLTREVDDESLKLFYSNRSSTHQDIKEMDFASDLTQQQVLTINLYLQINLVMMCINAKEVDDDEERQSKIKDFKERNIKFISQISKIQNQQYYTDLIQIIKQNCQVCLSQLSMSRQKNKIKGLKYLIQIIYNFIKNYMTNFLEAQSQENLKGEIRRILESDNNLLDYLMKINQDINDSSGSDKTGQMKVEVNINMVEELKQVYVLIQDEFKNQKEQKEKQHVQIKNKMLRTKKLIESIFQANSQTIFNSVLNDQNDSTKKLQYVVTFKMFDHWDHFLDLCVIKLTKDYFKCTIHFCKENYEPIIIPDKLTRIQVSRLFIKKVSKIGGFVINPLSGQITFTYCTYNNLSKYSEEQVDNFLIRVIKSIFSTAFFMINMYMLSLYAKIGLISIPIYKQLEDKHKKNNQQNNKNKTIFLHELTIRRLNNCIDLLENSVKPFSEFENGAIFVNLIDYQDQQDIIKCLKVIENSSPDADTQLEPIKVLDYDEKKLKKISAGGFSDIFQIELNYMPKNQDIKRFHNFAIKLQKKDSQAKDAEKIEKEVNVIRHIKPRSKFITKYYYDEETKDRLYMDLYFYSMGSYAFYHNSIMSLNKRVQMVLQVAQGVKFLQSIEIYHLDLKPPNILLDEEQNIKICDFGESYCKKNHTEQGVFQRTGRTLPYSPIESLNNNNFSAASDVYSIGAIISEIIFDKKLIEFKRINQQKLQVKLNQRNYRLIYSDLVVKEFGIKQIMKILKVLMLKCVNPDPTCRPHVEYLIAILYLILQVLNDLY